MSVQINDTVPAVLVLSHDLDNHNEKRIEDSTVVDSDSGAQASPTAVAGSDNHGIDEVEPPQYATPKELSLLSTIFTIATFMIAIDGSILATAIPRITSDFNRLDDVAWYGSAYLLTEMSFQPTFGRIYSLFDARITYLLSIIVFEIGSILCAAAPNSVALIIGRTISGAGAAGLLCGSLAIFGTSVPLRTRPLGMALVTSVYGVANVIGPTLGGLITDTPRLTWRFCFWINLPMGAVTFGIALFTLKAKTPIFGKLPLLEKLKKLDLLAGLLLLNGSLIALFIALQWGGIRYKWSDGRVLGPLITFGVLITAFIAVQIKKGEDATIPMRMFKQRTVAVSCAFNYLMSKAVSAHSLYMPFYFQAVLGTNAVTSGVRSLAYGIPCSVAIIVTGACITAKGHYVPFMWLGTSIFLTGCVLIRTLDVHSPLAKWIGYQVVTGLGLGLTEQIPFIAVQVVLPEKDMPTACAFVVFSRLLGGAVGMSIATNLFSGGLLPRLMVLTEENPLIDANAVVHAGASELAKVVPAGVLSLIRQTFGYGISRAFIMPIVLAGLSWVILIGMEQKWIPDDRNLQPKVEKSEGSDEIPTSSEIRTAEEKV